MLLHNNTNPSGDQPIRRGELHCLGEDIDQDSRGTFLFTKPQTFHLGRYKTIFYVFKCVLLGNLCAFVTLQLRHYVFMMYAILFSLLLDNHR